MPSEAHPLEQVITDVRKAIVKGDVTEHVKWNAPSFRIDGDDRVTFNIRPEKLLLIFHRGAKKNTKAFTFSDDTGLMTFAAPDRASITIPSLAEWKKMKKPVVTLIAKWMQATRA